MREGVPHERFTSPEEEIAFLRERIALRERELLSRQPEADHNDFEAVAKTELREYGMFTPKVILDRWASAGWTRAREPSGAYDEYSYPCRRYHGTRCRKGDSQCALGPRKVDNPYVIDEVHRPSLNKSKVV
jgi:hypothetical protein